MSEPKVKKNIKLKLLNNNSIPNKLKSFLEYKNNKLKFKVNFSFNWNYLIALNCNLFFAFFPEKAIISLSKKCVRALKIFER